MRSNVSTGKKTRKSVNERVREFSDLAGRINIAGIKELSKSNPAAAYMAAQELERQLEQQLLQGEAAYEGNDNEKAAQLMQEMDGKPEDELKTEKGLELQAQLPFQKKQQLQSIQQLKMEIENAMRARKTITPTPSAG